MLAAGEVRAGEAAADLEPLGGRAATASPWPDRRPACRTPARRGRAARRARPPRRRRPASRPPCAPRRCARSSWSAVAASGQRTMLASTASRVTVAVSTSTSRSCTRCTQATMSIGTGGGERLAREHAGRHPPDRSRARWPGRHPPRRGCRTWPGRCSRRARGGTSSASRHSPRSAGPVAHQERDRRPQREAVAHAREDLDRVGLAPLGGDGALPGAAAVELALDLLDGDRQAGRAAVDHHADGGAVRLPEGRHPKHRPEAVPAHRSVCPGRSRSCHGDRFSRQHEHAPASLLDLQVEIARGAVAPDLQRARGVLGDDAVDLDRRPRRPAAARS